MRNVVFCRRYGNLHHDLPLFTWSADQRRHHHRPSTPAGRHLARRGVPVHRADLIAQLAGLGGGVGR